MEMMCPYNPIHINELPKDTVLKILSCLPIQDAVRTSILSRKWRYSWTELPCLVFNDSFCEESIINKRSKLIKTIYQVLLLHHGPLCKFKLCLSAFEGSCSEIDQFVLVVLRKGVMDFTICILKGEPYNLPSSIFAYGQQLERLELSSCVFQPPSGFNGFSKLDRLVLKEVDISGSGFSSLISNCPLLRWLDFSCSTSCGRLDIVAPNLKYLSLECLCMSLCFKDTPKLAKVEIYSGDVEDDVLNKIVASSHFMLSGRLPLVDELTLDNFYLQYATASRAPRSFVNDLCRLKTISLTYICFGISDEVVSALCLIRNTPNLETLTIIVHTVDAVPDEELIEVDDFSDVTLGYLKKVEFRQASGLKCELQFIKLMLAKSPVLEIFFIELDPDLTACKELRFFKELSRFRRASPLAEISYEGVGASDIGDPRLTC